MGFFNNKKKEEGRQSGQGAGGDNQQQPAGGSTSRPGFFARIGAWISEKLNQLTGGSQGKNSDYRPIEKTSVPAPAATTDDMGPDIPGAKDLQAQKQSIGVVGQAFGVNQALLERGDKLDKVGERTVELNESSSIFAGGSRDTLMETLGVNGALGAIESALKYSEKKIPEGEDKNLVSQLKQDAKALKTSPGGVDGVTLETFANSMKKLEETKSQGESVQKIVEFAKSISDSLGKLRDNITAKSVNSDDILKSVAKIHNESGKHRGQGVVQRQLRSFGRQMGM